MHTDTIYVVVYIFLYISMKKQLHSFVIIIVLNQINYPNSKSINNYISSSS